MEYSFLYSNLKVMNLSRNSVYFYIKFVTVRYSSIRITDCYTVEEIEMEQQISDSELDIMKIIWANEGPARFACIMDELAEKYSHYASVTAYG